MSLCSRTSLKTLQANRHLRARADSAQSPCGSFEISSSPALVRLEVIALSPFVPRIDENERFFSLPILRTRYVDDGSQPIFVELGCRPDEDSGSPATSR